MMRQKPYARLANLYLKYRGYRKSNKQDVRFALRLERDSKKNSVIYVTTSPSVPGGPYVFVPYWLRDF